MPYLEARPPSDLAAWIDRIATSSDGSEPPAAPIRLLPNGRASLLFTWSGSGLQVDVVGPHTRPLWVWDREPVDKIEVRLVPGALAVFLDTPADPLVDASVPLPELLGSSLRQELRPLEALPDCSRLVAVAAWLRRRAPPDPGPGEPLRAALRLLEGSGGQLPVGAVAGRLGVSERTLARQFRHHVGLGPKAYARWLRVGRALGLLRAGVPVAECALRSGFSDQSHLSREVKRWTGGTPREHARSSSS